ncbi:magnesium transporter CorA family protein [Falsirhodobacter xinxiangensis]|uniref:magnesium transporter CorA family protein n=1 Tax=Falsirhodobacter xinxiangensis TaxID=2530049 RepID=UPI0010A9A6CF|nr:magnesium transporter CorA family protein [Rhodobacter xinxiangensis]
MIEHHFLTPQGLKSVEGAPPSAEGILWVDLCNPTRWEEKLIEDRMGVQVPTRAEMADIEDSSRLYVEGDALVMTAVVIEGVQDGRPKRAQLTFVLLPHVLITVRYTNPLPLRTVAARIARAPHECDTAPRLMATILEAVVERIADVLEQTSADLSDLSDTIFFTEEESARKPKPGHDLQSLVRRLGRKSRTLSILRESMLSLDRLIPFLRTAGSKESDRPTPKGTARLKGIERDLRSLSAYESQVEQELTFLHSATIGLIGVEQNQIIKVLSVATALFLPPTLVGTIYGMNFRNMPELDWRYGYPLAIAAMVLSALLPYIWFRRKKWL